jgi:hypothetical protein
VHVRVLTLNVQSNEGDSRRLGALNRELRRFDPDLVALQEVLHTPDRKQAQAMGYEPPWADRYGGKRRRHPLAAPRARGPLIGADEAGAVQELVGLAALAFDAPIDGTWVSDHYGVFVNLDIGANT